MNTTLLDTLMELQRLLLRYRSVQMRSTADSLEAGRGKGRVLTLLQRTGPMAQKQMAYLLGSTQHDLGEIIRRLELAGYVTRTRAEHDRGPVIVALTEKGESVHFNEDTCTEVFEVLSAKEQLQMEEYLDRLCSRVSELLEWKDMPVIYPPKNTEPTPLHKHGVFPGMPVGSGAPTVTQPQKPSGPTPQERWRDRIQHTSREDLCRNSTPGRKRPRKPSDNSDDEDKE